jgi:hypothetical protein
MDEADIVASEMIGQLRRLCDPSRFTSTGELTTFWLPALEQAASENAEKRKNDFLEYLNDILRYVEDIKKQFRFGILVPLFSILRVVMLTGEYDGMQAGYALHKYGIWLDRQEWLKKVMRVMRDYPGITPERMCRELDRRYKQTVSRTGKHREEKATPETWDNLTWIQELLMNRTNVDVLRSKAKKQLESENFKLLCAWYKLDGKDPLSKRDLADDKEFD